MISTFYTIEPFDTVAFRDGRPFEQNDQGLAETTAVFPPPTPAVCGATMAALGAELGARIGANWRDLARAWRVEPVLSARGEDLSRLLGPVFSGPYLALGAADPSADITPDLYLPCPQHRLFANEGSDPAKVINARPSASSLHSNLAAGRVKLECADGKLANVKSAEGWFVSARTWEELLGDAKHPLQERVLIHTSTVAKNEPRVGLAIDKAKGSAMASMLYAADHHRIALARGQIARIAVEGPKLESLGGARVDRVAPFGGEGRFARIRGPFETEVRRAKLRADSNGRLSIRIVALSPIPCREGFPWGVDLALAPELAGAIIEGAVHPSPRAVGFVDRATFGGDPRKPSMRVVRCFAAGSTWFANVDCAPGQELTDLDAGRLAPPDLAAYGFGRFRIGAGFGA